MTYEQNTQWLEASKHDVTQWAAVMERDADDRIIDWDWVRSLDFVAGVGAGARLDLWRMTSTTRMPCSCRTMRFASGSRRFSRT